VQLLGFLQQLFFQQTGQRGTPARRRRARQGGAVKAAIARMRLQHQLLGLGQRASSATALFQLLTLLQHPVKFRCAGGPTGLGAALTGLQAVSGGQQDQQGAHEGTGAGAQGAQETGWAGAEGGRF